MAISSDILDKLSQKYKTSSINVMKRQLKMVMGDVEVNYETLTGKIAHYCDHIEKMKYKNSKIYFQALFNVLSCINYDPYEYKLLESKLCKHRKICGEKREEKKQNLERLDNNLLMDFVISKRKHWEEQCNKQPSNKVFALNWLIASFYSDFEFAPKRPSDLIGIKYEDIEKTRIIEYECSKTGGKYVSKPLSDNIWCAVTHSRKLTHSPYLFFNIKMDSMMDTDNLRKRLYVVFDDKVNVQYLRTLWASYKYSKTKHPKEYLNHSYELNHTITTHLNDYVGEYPETEEVVVINGNKFKRMTVYVPIPS